MCVCVCVCVCVCYDANTNEIFVNKKKSLIFFLWKLAIAKFWIVKCPMGKYTFDEIHRRKFEELDWTKG